MSNCCDDKARRYECGGPLQNAVCVKYDGKLPKYSKHSKPCVRVEDNIEEIYSYQEDVLKHIDTSELGNDCLKYPKVNLNNSQSTILIKDVLIAFEEEICNIKQRGGSSGGTASGINLSGLDMKCLSSPCTKPDSLVKVLQVIIDKVCDLDVRLTKLEKKVP